jgi:hypothetical protein
MKTIKQLTDYFQHVGANEVSHTRKSYLAHAVGVYTDLRQWGCREEMARVGLFHSMYGTELFQGFTLPLERRCEIQDLIGKRYERIAWLNCAIDRRHFDQEILKTSGPYQILNRFDGKLVEVSDDDFEDLGLVHLCDWAEQVERSNAWDYRRTAVANLARRVGGIGESRYKTIFAKAPPQEWLEEYIYPPAAYR